MLQKMCFLHKYYVLIKEKTEQTSKQTKKKLIINIKPLSIL